MPEPILFMITGTQGAGKTTFCQNLVQAAQEAGWYTTGLLSHAVYHGSRRIAIEAEDIITGNKRQLATRDEDHPSPGSRYWQFHEDTLAWGNEVLSNSIPCDLLVIDELGPLEFDQGRGWLEGLAAIDSKQYAIAVIVVRPELLGEALIRWNVANLIEIETFQDSVEKARLLSEQLF